MQQNNDIRQIFLGFLLLIGMHIVAIFLLFILGLVIGQTFGNYIFLGIWMYGGMSFLFWQLLYVIPVILSLKRRQKVGMMKGVIIGAVITALLNGACSVAFFGVLPR